MQSEYAVSFFNQKKNGSCLPGQSNFDQLTLIFSNGFHRSNSVAGYYNILELGYTTWLTRKVPADQTTTITSCTKVYPEVHDSKTNMNTTITGNLQNSK